VPSAPGCSKRRSSFSFLCEWLMMMRARPNWRSPGRYAGCAGHCCTLAAAARRRRDASAHCPAATLRRLRLCGRSGPTRSYS
jgi:hypothetical protein